MNWPAQTIWFVFGLVFLGLLLDYAPSIGAGAVVLVVLYLAFKIIPQLPQVATATSSTGGRQ